MSDAGSNGGDGPDSLLPYEAWTEEAFRSVAVRALAHVAANGLPGEHHFYITFRTDHPGTVLPQRLRAKYPDEMTIVLQHKFWDLTVNNENRFMSVGLSFGGISTTLVVPFDAITGFADPSVKWGLRFRPVMPERPAAMLRAVDDAEDIAPTSAAGVPVSGPPAEPAAPRPDATPQVVSLDAFRKRKD
jgi:uncharacterized protein